MKSENEHRKKLHHYNTPGHAHELTFSCYRRSDYFMDSAACEFFLNVLSESRQYFRFNIWAYIIMPNHVHLLIWPLEAKYDIAKIDGAIKGITSKRYSKHLLETDTIKYRQFLIKNGENEKFRFWQHGGGFDRNMWNPKVIYDSIGYIEANPVRKGFSACPEKYRWSSAWARVKNQGLVPDKYKLPVLMPDPQKQKIGKM